MADRRLVVGSRVIILNGPAVIGSNSRKYVGHSATVLRADGLVEFELPGVEQINKSEGRWMFSLSDVQPYGGEPV